MAITKIMNIKQSAQGNASHLQASIRYIMNPKKTENGSLIGGNAGSSPEEVFETMMETKISWGKEDGRQGYHFVISFPPGEATKEQVYHVLQDFCDEYLGQSYDHVFSVHTDTDHLHGHLVFNSVNSISGYKYHYKQGDWEKYIQPVTDRICERYGLPPLVYDKEAKKGVSYAEVEAEKQGKPTWSKIIKADIDHVIQEVNTFDEFLQKMYQMGYRIREGKHMTFYPPGGERGRRDTTLGEGYTKEDITERILHKEKNPTPTRFVSEELQLTYDRFYQRYTVTRLPAYQKKRMIIFYCAGHYLDKNNPYIVDYKTIRKKAMQINTLYRECKFIMEHNIQKEEDLQKELQSLESQKKLLQKRKRELNSDRTASGYQGEIEKVKGNLREVYKEIKLVKSLISQKQEMETKDPVRDLNIHV
ncbi:MAG: relaxase/mobilization nuclease domain-containing protein [Eubacteriales bacterium]|nr:relaxase/mobilization nuclease domain-containing protein [Eubacteriales bacterium]